MGATETGGGSQQSPKSLDSKAGDLKIRSRIRVVTWTMDPTEKEKRGPEPPLERNRYRLLSGLVAVHLEVVPILP